MEYELSASVGTVLRKSVRWSLARLNAVNSQRWQLEARLCLEISVNCNCFSVTFSVIMPPSVVMTEPPYIIKNQASRFALKCSAAGAPPPTYV